MEVRSMNRINGMVMEGWPMNRTVDNPYALAAWLAFASAAQGDRPLMVQPEVLVSPAAGCRCEV